MNVFVVIGGLADWALEGGDEFATSVIGVYSSAALADAAVNAWADGLRGGLADDEFWSEVIEKSLDALDFNR